MEMIIPLEIDNITIEGLSLRVSCYQPFPDRAVTFQLEMGIPEKRTRLPLLRFDWRPLNSPHKNPRRGHSFAAGQLIFGTHFHQFSLNWVQADERMRSGNLPFAIQVEPDPTDFKSVLDDIRSLFRISNIDLIQEPGWSRRLL